MSEELQGLEDKLRGALRSNIISGHQLSDQLKEAEKQGLLTADECARLSDLDERVMALIAVDDFDARYFSRNPAHQTPDAT